MQQLTTISVYPLKTVSTTALVYKVCTGLVASAGQSADHNWCGQSTQTCRDTSNVKMPSGARMATPVEDGLAREDHTMRRTSKRVAWHNNTMRAHWCDERYHIWSCLVDVRQKVEVTAQACDLPDGNMAVEAIARYKGPSILTSTVFLSSIMRYGIRCQVSSAHLQEHQVGLLPENMHFRQAPETLPYSQKKT